MKRALFATAILIPVAAWACGPDLHAPYFEVNGQHFNSMPAALFWCEMNQLIFPDKPVPSAPGPTNAYTGPGISDSGYTTTTDIEKKEIEAALAGRADANALMEQYGEFRKSLHHYADDVAISSEGTWIDGMKVTPHENRPFDLPPYENLLAALPQEFALYLRGAVEYHAQHFESAASYFNQVLALPEHDRSHRTVWATYMLAKTWRSTEPEKAIPYYEQTRALAGAGFSDPLDLARASRIWQARAETEAGHYAAAIHMAVDHARSINDASGIHDLIIWICVRALQPKQKNDPDLVNDPLCRKMMTAFRLSYTGGRKAASWLKQVNAALPKGRVEDAERLAWLAYDAGDMAGAAQWLKYADPNLPGAKWVQARLLLREGRIDEGTKLLESIHDTKSEDMHYCLDPNLNSEYDRPPDTIPDLVNKDLAFALTRSGRYADAVTAYAHAHRWDDAAYLCERLLTLDDARAWLKDHAEDPELQEPLKYKPEFTQLDRLRTVVARRLARENRWNEASDYYPDTDRTTQAKDMARFLAATSDKTLSAQERAQNYFDAAHILRESGMPLMGTEFEPDWTAEDGLLSIDVQRVPNGKAEWGNDSPIFGPTVDEAGRFSKSLPAYFKRFHYRYVAADLYWSCAALLPNNDVLAAHALYEGGKWLSNRDPQSADRFYKALVRRNPNLSVAIEANRLRWFPREFYDEVAYTSLPKHFSRHAIAVFCAVALFIAFIALLDLRDQRRKRMQLSVQHG